MLLIGNQIRLTRALLAAAVRQQRDSLFQTLARQQVEAGATYLLVDMGPQHKGSAGELAWLVETIHSSISVPLALRSDDPVVLEAGLKAARDKILIDATLPAVADLTPYIALAQRYRAKLAFSPMVPATEETLRLLKVGAVPAPNTLVHLDDIADGVADAAKPFVSQAYTTMLLAAGIDVLVANPLDPDLMEVIRVVRERDATTAYDRLLLRLYDATSAGAPLDIASVDQSDPDQVALYKTVQVLTNQLIYADSYLRA